MASWWPRGTRSAGAATGGGGGPACDLAAAHRPRRMPGRAAGQRAPCPAQRPPDRCRQQDRRKAAHLAGFICPHCPHSKGVCPQSKWGQNSSMVTGTYAGFSGLSPLSPRKKNDSRKKAGASRPHPATWCPHFRGHLACLVATCAPGPPCWVLPGCSVCGSFTARSCASLCSGKRVNGEW
jgi:hypothetical protein